LAAKWASACLQRAIGCAPQGASDGFAKRFWSIFGYYSVDTKEEEQIRFAGRPAALGAI
jgi:hypothetical protein